LNLENTLVAKVKNPEDIYRIFPWNRLSYKSQTTLRWSMSRAGIDFEPYKHGFNFDLLMKLTLDDLKDTKHVGKKRAQELIDELSDFFTESMHHQDETAQTFLEHSPILQNCLETSLKVLAFITVEEKLNEYLARISKFKNTSELDFRDLLLEYRRNKSKNWFNFYKRRDTELILLQLIQNQIQQPYIISRNLYPELELRTKILAGNLGLLGAILTFDKGSPTSFPYYSQAIIKDFIENLVFLGNLKYRDLEKLLIEGRSNHKNSIQEVGLLGLVLSSEANLAEIFEYIELKFQENPKIDDRTILILKERLPIFQNSPKTLEAIAQEFNLTRERVRQIAKKSSHIKVEPRSDIKCLIEAVECLTKSVNEESFLNEIGNLPSIGEIPLNVDRLRALCEFFSSTDLVSQIDKKVVEWESTSEVDSEFIQELRKSRSPMGLYDLKFLLKKFQISRKELEDSIARIYPRTIFRGDLALARTKNLDSMFENSVAKQLLVTSNLDVDELIIGLKRTARNRGITLIGSREDLSQLIKFLAGEIPNYQNISVRMLNTVALQSVETWLVDVFKETNGSILHSYELVSRALKDHINVSSLQVYLANSPIVRTHSGSIYSIVGTRVDIENIEIYRSAILASNKSTEIDFSVSSDGIELKIRPNLNVITSGIVFPPSGLKKMVTGYTFDSTCTCGQLVSRQQVKFSASGFWTGFTAMIRHGIKEHDMTQESLFIFSFNFEKNKVTLQIN
jgi:DNA-directed RNA polymerase sigma subunit (sigma70/sigma32)